MEVKKSYRQKSLDMGASILKKKEAGTFIPLIIMLTVMGIANREALSSGNMLDVLRTSTYSFIVAAPLTFLMISGGMDLSIGAVTSLGGVICGYCLVAGMPVWVSITFGVLSGAIIGVIKALFVIKMNLPPFIVTLGIQYAVNGFLLVITNGISIAGYPAQFKAIGQKAVFGKLYYTIIIAIVIGIVFHIILNRTKYGRKIIAVGGNMETAYLAGIKVNPLKAGIHILVSVFAAFAGVLLASRFSSSIPTVGSGTELTIMASVIIGGTSLAGGVGSISGTAIGCLLLSVITNGLVLMRVSSYWQNFIFGLILLLSIVIDKYRQTISRAA
jgi:ribose/xylose/arabinose/galactoside ABC-type transport system permease subunit